MLTPPQARPPARGGFFTVRRRHVDAFFTRQAPGLSGWVLDLGGVTILRRGTFDLSAYPVRAVAANLSPAKRPDVVCDAAALPFAGASFDAAICAELLEHVPRPEAVLGEVARVLRPGATLLITAPFLYRIHGDPHDYGRYTDQFWSETLTRLGFEGITVERQGLFWSVVMDMLTQWGHELNKRGQPRLRLVRGLLRRALALALRRAEALDARAATRGDGFHSSFTTGFGIVARRGA